MASRIRYVDEDLAAAHAQQTMARIAEEVTAGRRGAAEPVPGQPRPWASFRDHRNRVTHRRRLFVAKYNPATWGDPWAERQVWHPTQPSCWVDDAPDIRNGVNYAPLSSPDLPQVMPGDLLVVHRLAHEYTDPGGGNRVRRSSDPSPYGGAPVLMGVWYVVRRHVRRFADGPRRASTALYHLPLVRFADPDVVYLETLFALDPALRALRPFTTPNWTLVGCADGDEEAMLAAACSLPSEVFTAPDLSALAARLAQMRCGMSSRAQRYRRDLRYRHQVRTQIGETAVRVAERRLARAGWSVISREDEPGWGGDLDCRQAGPAGIEQLCVEVKGTRYDPWPGHVHLQPSQRDRAHRTATGQPRPDECGYDWQLHIQPGIATTHRRERDRQLPPLQVHNAAWVESHWLPDWVNR